MAAEATLLAHASPVLKVRPLPLAAGLLEALQSESPRSDGGSTPSPTAKPGDDYSPPLEAALLADGQCCMVHPPGCATCDTPGAPQLPAPTLLAVITKISFSFSFPFSLQA